MTEYEETEQSDVKELAYQHWDYVGSVVQACMNIAEKMYVDAFIHGYKHGQETAAEQQTKKETP